MKMMQGRPAVLDRTDRAREPLRRPTTFRRTPILKSKRNGTLLPRYGPASSVFPVRVGNQEDALGNPCAQAPVGLRIAQKCNNFFKFEFCLVNSARL